MTPTDRRYKPGVVEKRAVPLELLMYALAANLEHANLS